MNWKLVVDTFLETYHINVLHRKTIHPILHSDLATFDGYNENLRLIAPRRTIDELREQPEAEWDLFTHTAIVSILFPNTVFIMPLVSVVARGALWRQLSGSVDGRQLPLG